jgi:hypothetical protein
MPTRSVVARERRFDGDVTKGCVESALRHGRALFAQDPKGRSGGHDAAAARSDGPAEKKVGGGCDAGMQGACRVANNPTHHFNKQVQRFSSRCVVM